MAEQKVYLLLQSQDQLINLSIGFVFLSTLLNDIYSNLLFSSKPNFKCSSSFALSRVDKVAAGASSFVLAIVNVPAPV